MLREGIQPVRLEIAEHTPLEHVMTFLGQALAWLPTHYDTHLTQESEPERFTSWLDDFIYWPYVPGRRIDFDDLYDTPEEHPDA